MRKQCKQCKPGKLCNECYCKQQKAAAAAFEIEQRDINRALVESQIDKEKRDKDEAERRTKKLKEQKKALEMENLRHMEPSKESQTTDFPVSSSTVETEGLKAFQQGSGASYNRNITQTSNDYNFVSDFHPPQHSEINQTQNQKEEKPQQEKSDKKPSNFAPRLQYPPYLSSVEEKFTPFETNDPSNQKMYNISNMEDNVRPDSLVTAPRELNPISNHHSPLISPNTLQTIKNEMQREADAQQKHHDQQLAEFKRKTEEQNQQANRFRELFTKTNSIENTKRGKTPFKRATTLASPIYDIPMEQLNYKPLKSVDVIEHSTVPNIGVIGLPKTGRSTLVGALAGGISPRNLTSNPVKTAQRNIYKLNYPNNGFINGSIEENRGIYEDFFQNSNLKNLSNLLITIDGNLREEDFLVITLSQKYKIPMAIIRTKLDEWLDNKPKNQSKEEYVENDKNFILTSLKELNFDFPKNHIYNVSALSMIVIYEDGINSDMVKYQQDENVLIEYLHNLPNSSAKNFNAISSYPHLEAKIRDVAVVGLKSAGKSAIIENLKRILNLSPDNFMEVAYDETMSNEVVMRQINNANAKLYLIVVPHTIGRIDAKLTKYFLNKGKKIAVILTRSDEIIDNMKKQKAFTTKEAYIRKRSEAANMDLQKFDLAPETIPLFAISAYALEGLVGAEYFTEERDFLNFLHNVLN